MGVANPAAEVAGAERGRAPAWLTWIVVVGLILVYAGERILGTRPLLHGIFSGAGALLLVIAILWRAAAWRRAEGDGRAVEKTFLLAYAGCGLAVLGFLLAGDLRQTLRIAPADADTDDAFDTVATVLACVLLSVSLFPMLAAHWALGGAKVGRATGTVDRLRVSQLAAAGLTVGLAAPFLMLTGYVATKNDQSLDVSFFKTASPGSASKQIVESYAQPLKVIFFFPPANEVRQQVLGYFRSLGGNVQIEEYDRFADPTVAEKYQVVRDGTVILELGDRTEQLGFDTDINAERQRLRKLDETVQAALMKVARQERVVYFTVGHGELNSPASVSATDTVNAAGAGGGTYAVEGMLDLLNFKFSNLTASGGLGNEIPADAAMVVVLGPKRAFLPPELDAIDRYLATGGSLLLAMEPDSDFDPGPLSRRISLTLEKVPLADDQGFIVYNRNASDHRFFATEVVSPHASLPNVGNATDQGSMVFRDAGYLKPILNAENTDVTYTVYAPARVFADKDEDFEFSLGEERREYPLAASIQGPPVGAQGEVQERPGMRAVVVADADAFSDLVMQGAGRNRLFFTDVVRWLGHEEDLAGETTSQADVAVTHTKNENIVWFYTTILGAPALVLFLGLWSVRRRRKPVVVGEAAA
jgi:hypothetical protein